MLRKKLAVVGGGAAGHRIAYELREAFDVTLIDPKTYWEVPMALPRLLVEPDALAAQMDYASFLDGVRLVRGLAVAIDEQRMLVDTGEGVQSVDFDFAVLATGSSYVDPLIKAEVSTAAERRAQIVAAHAELLRAQTVVVAGGGPVGVETAAELAETFPHLHVTLIHGASKLLDTAPTKFGRWAAEQLADMGVEIHYHDLVVEPAVGKQPDHGIRTRLGFTAAADVVIWAAGARPNTGFIIRSWPTAVQKNGLVKTDEHLHVEGHPNVFVAGDITNLPEGRLAITASFHVPVIVANLLAIAKADSTADAILERYQPKRPGKGLGKLMVVTLGREDGLTSLPFGQFRASFIARNMKSRNMFVDKYRKAVGLPTSETSLRARKSPPASLGQDSLRETQGPVASPP